MLSLNKYVADKDKWLQKCLIQVILAEYYRENKSLNVKTDFLKDNTMFPYTSVEESLLLNSILD